MKEAFAVCVRQKSRIIIYEGSMLPRGYKSLVICDTHRAEEWKAGLARAGSTSRSLRRRLTMSRERAW